MNAPPNDSDTVKPPGKTEVRYLHPDSCIIHVGTHSALHVTIKNERIYGGVYAVYAFPVAYPEGYISLMYTASDGKELEIGVIRDMKELPPEQINLVRQALVRRYFIHTITNIRRIAWKYGFVSFEVDTDKGQANFLMRWQHDRAADYGRSGKILIDTDQNRYLIPDMEKLQPDQRRDFQRYIYW